MTRRSKPCTWNGIEYPSIAQAAIENECEPSVLAKRLKRGYTCDDDVPGTSIPICWNGITYKSLNDAGEAAGMTAQKVKKLVAAGYTSDADCLKPPKESCPDETWKPIPNYEDLYQISDHGRVWHNAGVGCSEGRFLKTSKSKYSGYRMTVLTRNAHSETFYVHRLVLEVFVGPCPEGIECCHNNGIPSDNRLENLRWDTPKNNDADKAKHGTMMRGEKHSNAKLTKTDVHSIYDMIDEGSKQSAISKRFGVTQSAISNISRGQRWSHLFKEKHDAA